MNVNDIFANASARMIEGIMMHEEYADYFDFLDLMGFKRLHEYQFLAESVEMRGIHRYFINHYNQLLNHKTVSKKSYIPSAWYGYDRTKVDPEAKKNAVKNIFETWTAWERESKKYYETCYCDLCDLHEIAGAMKMKEIVCDVDMELKQADRLLIMLDSMKYDLPSMFLMQDEMHEMYRQKEKEMGVDIC